MLLPFLSIEGPGASLTSGHFWTKVVPAGQERITGREIETERCPWLQPSYGFAPQKAWPGLTAGGTPQTDRHMSACAQLVLVAISSPDQA